MLSHNELFASLAFISFFAFNFVVVDAFVVAKTSPRI